MPSSKHTPASIIPQLGKSFEHCAKSVSSQIGAVLREDKRRLHLANNSEHLEPQTRTSSFQTDSFPCTRDVLAGEASADDVDVSAPLGAVEGIDVVPDGELIEEAVALALGEDSLAVLVDLDGADSAPAEQTTAGKQPAAGPGK